MSTQSRDCNQAAAPQELSLAEMGKKLDDEAKPVVKRLEKELNLVIQSLAEMEKKLQEAKPVVKCLVEELNPVIQRLSEMEEVYKVSLQKAGLAEMEKFYKRKIQEERSAHEKTKEEYKSFKDRVAGDVDLALKTGNSEDMNDPVNETRLKEMYKELRKDWPKIKSYLQTTQSDPEIMKAWIQHSFQHGADETEQKKKQIDSAFNLHADDTPASEKVHKYTKLTLHNLQLVVYYRFKDTAVQEGEPCDDSWNNLLSKCHWLSCLLVLNDPPLQPDWKNHHPGQDAWNFFPQEIIADSAMSHCQDHSEHVRKCPWTFQHPDVNQTEDIEMKAT
ncbi:uncharacterized protein LOC120437417 [Oreochromis aureus]|uniref:uncharacterized protein LOC120437417 n=1 Tax=Oreochromis aureus TaxID=47969 RepID=UPI001954ECC4|nr:uncharacterized protein LOC120437417 [Oreochromis aureus]